MNTPITDKARKQIEDATGRLLVKAEMGTDPLRLLAESMGAQTEAILEALAELEKKLPN